MADQNKQQSYSRMHDLLLRRILDRDTPENREKEREDNGAYDLLGDPKADPEDVELPNRSGKIDPTLRRRNHARQQTLVDILVGKVHAQSDRHGRPDWIDYPDPDK